MGKLLQKRTKIMKILNFLKFKNDETKNNQNYYKTDHTNMRTEND